MTHIETFVAQTLRPEEIRKFLKECADTFPAEIGEPDLYEWPNKLAKNADCICVRCDRGKLRAALFAYLNDTTTHIGYIPLLCVLPGSPHGIGHQLHESLVSFAPKRGITCIRLEVYKMNGHAIAFYSRQGYNIIEDRDDRGRWLMELPLEKYL